MESLSRPFHSKNLSDAPYDVVFSGNRRKYSQPSPIPLQDYREIFSTSEASSIPVLDLSTLTQPVDSLSFNFKDLKPDYSKIFGGFCDESVAVSYEELFGCDKVRAPSSTSPSSQDSDNLSRQSPDALKQFSMSYNKINPKSKDGLDGTKHVTQVPPVTGFTCFVDEPVMEAGKPNLSAFNIKSSRNVVRKENNPVESISEDKKAKTFDVDFKRCPSMVSSSPIGVVNDKDDSKRSVNSEPSKTDFDEEIDVNSAAFALKKAIEKAQESIRIAKESVGRKKNGLRSFSNNKFKNSSKVEEQKRRDEDSSQGFQDVGRNRKYGGTVVLPSFTESEKLFVAKKFIDEIHEKISESVKDSKFVDDTVASNATQVTSETEAKPADSAGKDEHANSCSEAVDTETSNIQTSDFVHECQTDNKIVDEYEAEIEVSEPTIDILEHPTVVKELESEENANEVSEDSNRNDNENRLDASLELLENEKQENVLEHEEVEYEESEKHEEIEEASELVESEKESEHDRNSEIRKGEETSEVFDDICDNKLEESEVNLHDDCETKQEDDHAVESKGERLDKSCDQEFDEKSVEDDDVIEETVDTDRVHVASNDVEMNDVNVETTQDIEVSCEFQAEEADFCEKTSIDRTVSDNNESEYEVKSDESNIIDNLADLGIENDVRSESSSGSTHGEKIIDEESNMIDNLADLGSENDVRSESSSASTHGETTIDEESNIKPPRTETPDTENTNEIKGKIVEESGPNKVSRKDRVKTIDEEAAAKEREWEKNRLAVDRAIREARERAFAEARERAERERAAVEKATEEVRQRMMAEAHEKVSKASVMKKSSSDKTSAQSKLRAERAAVERATAEARQRALEKAISQKTASELNRSESALRTKAKLEKHNRIMERAAKALAEKEKRDRLAQKEQAERNRLAENLDADIKRWSNGKEGNLRALLSTLQYILGPESGWQPVTLTEIITTSAVKKAYRKATLCVHPDKLQQRGATIQQKYICEKVFDLLKAAWNKFNSEER
ncbi:putative DnaJ domain, Chaperone J-domain superfamily [Helianthus annuus]|uniref:DnaJ domain, Chaperone J-domain superfamily n=1 Tax=Helianthus annuus TaxID=4232 RepID=A0A251UST2_HELAN|nr:auxilin-like protein 1 [Helianthus annuus]KAF5806713.1 putative DnaJ domain, Chaperone J-domain superfamily [Helianthus annuus]